MTINNKLKYLFLDSLSNITLKKLIFLWLFYALSISLASILFGYLLNVKINIYDEEFNIIFKNISFSNGDLIYNLYYNNEYFTEFKNIKFYLQKTPAIPYLIYYISLISKNFFLIIIVKNLIVYSLYFFISFASLKSLNHNFLSFILLLLIPIIIPYNFIVSLNFVYEDSLIALIVPCIYLLAVSNYKNKFVVLGFLCFVLYFVKTSVVFIIIIISLLIVIYEKKIFLKYIPLIFSLLAIIIWGMYGLVKTDRFSFMSTSSSINSYVMSFAYNENFHKYYPYKSTDLIPIDQEIPNNINTEWELYDHYKEKNLKYLNKNYKRYLEDTFIKLKFIFFGIKRDSSFPDEFGNYNNRVRISQIISKFIINFCLILILYKTISSFKNLIRDKKNIYFIAIVIFGLFPHVIVWATSKHLVPTINICLIYLLLSVNLRKHLTR